MFFIVGDLSLPALVCPGPDSIAHPSINKVAAKNDRDLQLAGICHLAIGEIEASAEEEGRRLSFGNRVHLAVLES